MVLPSCGEYKPINQVALLSSNPTKSVAISSRAAGASAEVDIPVSVKIHVWQSGTLTEPRPSPHRIWKAPPFHGARRLRPFTGPRSSGRVRPQPVLTGTREFPDFEARGFGLDPR